MKKKIISTLLIASTLLCGCGSLDDITSKVANSMNENKADVDNSTGGSVSGSVDGIGSAPSEDELDYQEFKCFEQGETITETVLLDDENLTIIAKNLELTESCAYLNVSITNKSCMDATVYSKSSDGGITSVNGYTFAQQYSDGEIYAEIPAGETVETQAEFYDDKMLEYGLTDIASIKYKFYVSLDYNMDPNHNSDSEDYDKYLYTTDVAEIRTSIYDSYDFDEDTLNNSLKTYWRSNLGYRLLNGQFEDLEGTNDVKVLGLANYDNDYSEHTLALEVMNVSDRIVYLNAEDVKYTGITTNQREELPLLPGEKGLFLFTGGTYLAEECPELFDISNIGSFSFKFFDRNTGDDPYIDLGTVTYIIDESITAGQVDGKILYDNNSFKFQQLKLSYDESLEKYYIPVKLEYSGDSLAKLSPKNIKINGKEVEIENYIPYSGNFYPGDVGFVSFIVRASELQELGINSIEDIKNAELEFYTSDANITLNIEY